jgi:hypothetical protein
MDELFQRDNKSRHQHSPNGIFSLVQEENFAHPSPSFLQSSDREMLRAFSKAVALIFSKLFEVSTPGELSWNPADNLTGDNLPFRPEWNPIQFQF